MQFLAPIPALIAAGIALPLLVVLYLLRLRRRRVTVSSTLLWRQALADLQVNAPFQKLRRNLLLLLQLLVLILLLLAMARPVLKGDAPAGRRLAVVVDCSASMRATDVEPTRFDAAVREADRLIDAFLAEAGDRGSVMLMVLGRQAKVVCPFTRDRARLRTAMRSLEATDEMGRLEPVLRLLEPYARQADHGVQAGGDRDAALAVRLLSDGRFGDMVDAADVRAARLPAGVDMRLVRVGSVAVPQNIGLVHLSLRRDPQQSQRASVLMRLIYTGSAATTTRLTVALDGRALRVVEVALPAAEENGAPGEASVVVEVLATAGGLLEAWHDGPAGGTDVLATDDWAGLVIEPPRPLAVLLVSGGNPFIRKAIEAVRPRRLTVMTPRHYQEQDPHYLVRDAADELRGYDVIVFDGFSPPQLPPTSAVFFNAVPPIEGLRLPRSEVMAASREGDGSEPPQVVDAILTWRRDHPVLRHVALDDLLLLDPVALEAPEDASVLATSRVGPVLVELTREGRRFVVVGFSPLRSNWPIQIGFVVFVENALEHLTGRTQERGPAAWRPGELLRLPIAPKSGRLVLDGPVRQEITLGDAAAGGTTTLVAPLRVGVYQVEPTLARPWDRLPVSLLDVTESDVRPGALMLAAVGSGEAASTTSQAAQRELWPWLAYAAMGLLMIEWVVYTRRMHL